MRWLDGVSDSMDMNLSRLQEIVKGSLARCSPWGRKYFAPRQEDVVEFCTCIMRLQSSSVFPELYWGSYCPSNLCPEWREKMVERLFICIWRDVLHFSFFSDNVVTTL